MTMLRRTATLNYMFLLIHQNIPNYLEKCLARLASLSFIGPLQRLGLNMGNHESLVMLSCLSQLYSLHGVGMEIPGNFMYIRIFQCPDTGICDRPLRYALIPKI